MNYKEFLKYCDEHPEIRRVKISTFSTYKTIHWWIKWALKFLTWPDLRNKNRKPHYKWWDNLKSIVSEIKEWRPFPGIASKYKISLRTVYRYKDTFIWKDEKKLNKKV